MFSRISIVLITIFWLIMNYLLWRSEFGGNNHTGTSVPVEAVWRKIVTAPDNSGLGIVHHNRQIGHSQWSANLGQELAIKKMLTDELPPDGMVESPTGYRISFGGNVALNDMPGRINFDFHLRLDTNQAWQEFSLVFRFHSSTFCEIRSRASEQAIHIKFEDENEKSDRIIKFADLQNPQTLAQQFELPIPPEILGVFGLPAKLQNSPALSAGLKWEARNDWITFGHTAVRAYRLQASLFDRYGIVIITSQVGEILRVELPDGWQLINDTLTNL